MDNTTKRRHFRAAVNYLNAARKSTLAENSTKAWEQAGNGLKQIHKLDAYSNGAIQLVERKLTIIQVAAQSRMVVD